MATKSLTLEQFLGTDNKVAEEGPAYFIHPLHRGKSDEQEFKKLLPHAKELLLESGVVVYTCTRENLVFETPGGIVAHNRRAHPEDYVETPESAEAKGNTKQLARRKTQSNARTDLAEPSYGELKKKYDAALTRIGELDRELKLSDKENKGLELAVVALKGKVEDLEKEIVDHSNCYEFVGKGRGNEGKEVDIVRKDGFVFRAYPV